jgi:hypothetical protein
MKWTYEDARRVQEEARRQEGSLEATGKTEGELATERAAKICEEMAEEYGPGSDEWEALRQAAARIRGEG